MAATPDEQPHAPSPPRATQRDTVRISVPPADPLAHHETVRLPLPRGGSRPPGSTRRAPLAVAAAIGTWWAALVSAAPVIAVVALTQLVDAPRVSVLGAIRYGLAGWLLAHGIPIRTSIGPVALVPLAIAALAVWRVARAGVHATRAIGHRHSRSPRHALSVGLVVGLWYGVIGVLAALVARGPGLAVAPLRAGLMLGAVGVLAGLAGSLSATGVGAQLAARFPRVVRDGVRTGLIGALLVLGSGAVLAGLAIALAGGDAAETLATYRTGVAGQAGITLLCLAYAPNLAAWGASYLLGPGFAIGADTMVRTSDVTLGALPALPVLAGLPGGPLPGIGGLLVGVPLAVGMVAGWLTAKRSHADGWLALCGTAALAGPVAGAVLGLVALISGGPLGAGRLAVVGPVAWQVAAVAAGVVAAGSLVGAGATRVMPGRRR